jgi:UDP-N-acetyl-D-glucosamine dehydrogenase
MVLVSGTKPFGFESYRLGLAELAGEVKCQMLRWSVQKVADASSDHGKSIKGSYMLVSGLTYKKNIDDPRESPAAEIMSLLQDKGATGAYSDPHIPCFPQKRAYHFDLKSVTLTVETVADYDCTILATDHDAFDYSVLKKYAAAIVDIRDRMRWESVVNA